MCRKKHLNVRPHIICYTYRVPKHEYVFRLKALILLRAWRHGRPSGFYVWFSRRVWYTPRVASRTTAGVILLKFGREGSTRLTVVPTPAVQVVPSTLL